MRKKNRAGRHQSVLNTFFAWLLVFCMIMTLQPSLTANAQTAESGAEEDTVASETEASETEAAETENVAAAETETPAETETENAASAETEAPAQPETAGKDAVQDSSSEDDIEMVGAVKNISLQGSFVADGEDIAEPASFIVSFSEKDQVDLADCAETVDGYVL